MLSLVRSDTTGEMELRGSSSKFKEFAARLRIGGEISVSLDEVPDPSPYDKSLSRVVIRSGSGKVVVTLMDDGQSLLINNDRDFHVETAVVAVLVQNDDGCPTSPNRMQRQVSRRQVPSHPGGTATATPPPPAEAAPRRCVTVLNSGEPVGRFATFVAAGVAFRGP